MSNMELIAPPPATTSSLSGPVRPAVRELRGSLPAAGSARAFQQFTTALARQSNVLSLAPSHFYTETQFGAIEAWREDGKLSFLLRSRYRSQLDLMRYQIGLICEDLFAKAKPNWAT